MNYFIIFLLLFFTSFNWVILGKEYNLLDYRNDKHIIVEAQDLLEKYSPRRDLGEDPQKAIEEWLQFRKEKKEPEELEEEKQEFTSAPLEIDLSCVIAKTLRNQWNIKIGRKEIVRQEGVYQSSKGPFDPVVGTSLKNSFLFDTQRIGFNTTKDGSQQTVELFLEKLTRIGTKFTVAGSLEREHNPSLIFANDFSRTNQYDLSFTIDQPLFKGLKYSAEAVQEKVEAIELCKVEHEYVQTIAEEIRDVVFKYW
ncbi:MAG: hypothetical protein KAR79_05115, partial [Simkaniaceae bacterium]|nr:hypothetical protein [Simkaniaceae bacterium]